MKKGLIFATLVLLVATAFTPATPVFQDGNCPSAPARLKQADIAVVTVGDGETLNLRVFPGLKQEIIVKIPAYTYVTIIAGPICDGGYRWFEVGWEGKDGWSAEVGPDGEYNMIPNDSPMPNTDSQDNNNENGNFNPFGYTPAPIFKIEAGTPYFFRDWENLQFRQIPNEDTLNALGFPKDQIDLIPGDDFILDPSLSLGPDVPDVHNDPDEFCAFKDKYFGFYPSPSWSPCGLVFDRPIIPTETPQPLVEAPIETSEDVGSNWFCDNLGMFCPVLAAEKPEFPRTPRPQFDDGDSGVQCTEYVQDIRPDALCWLEQPANGNRWVKQLSPSESEYLGITHDDNPKTGDIVVWESNCSTIKNHVGIVVQDASSRCGSNQVAVADANHNDDGKVYDGNQYTCYAVNTPCMEFIHQSTKQLDASTCTVKLPYCDQFKGLRKFWCNLTGK